MAEVLLTVSGLIAPDTAERIAQGQRPRADYLELELALDADLIDYAEARQRHRLFGRLLEQIGGADLLLAWACFCVRKRYRAIFTDGEQIGIPLAGMLKYFGWLSPRPQHIMIVHILSVKKKILLIDLLGLQTHIDRFLVYATRQKEFIEQHWKVSPERVIFTPFMVDDRFFSLQHVTPKPSEPPTICAVGLEARDYLTLLQAVDGLPAHVVIAAASPWSKRTDATQGQHIPANVTVKRFSQFELRQLYADSALLVMPLHDVEFQAGVTAILEAMAMERAVICSRTSGQTDVVVEGETGIYVAPTDINALRQAIVYLLAHPDEAARLGSAGRKRIEQSMNIDHYSARLSQIVQQALMRETPTGRNTPSTVHTAEVRSGQKES